MLRYCRCCLGGFVSVMVILILLLCLMKNECLLMFDVLMKRWCVVSFEDCCMGC